MKQKTSLAVCLLLATAAQGLKLNDIFDAYDQESALEQLKQEDTIDPNALAAEIGGEDIARDVINATGGISDASLLQLSYDGDENDDGEELSDKQKKIVDRVNAWRRYEQNTEGEDAKNRRVYNSVTGIENTHSTYPRQINNGFDDKETEPKDSLAQKKINKNKQYRPDFEKYLSTRKDWENLEHEKEQKSKLVYGAV